MAKEMKDLQKQWHSMMETIHSNPHVVAFMNSRLGRYLDNHPFVTLSLLVFMAVSAVPVAFFLIFAISTTIIACLGMVIIEGFVVSLGGVTLLCVLGGLGLVSLAVSGLLSVSYLALRTMLSYWSDSNGLSKKEAANGISLPPNSSPALDKSATNKSE
ncbi:lipid droplet assembly factor 1 isoform X1 [Eublepharis macularius]|uniref:Lipid droplet assembly factor 1 isoform X1 n=1 Tax=Eublepharis macularius TaxID=481883 RepID=A0AA97LCZ8_EUBMA|nr:lipid droplet assembly factor 1 isoform X1 [Eublepharis macularius]XP_054851298.1 lipid droplet assembly factor 1 isoform X1 [Eublepharis macularius]XP_054851299.1 lipid droplet assembly factor 1 isoform X1 [Eublepharis macularius]XP_054851300.1 lipid droplet assembly factor 1 isoform X1 [Eublepharis macularius]